MIEEEAYQSLFADYSFESVIYLISPNLEDPMKVLYLHKDKPEQPTHNKLIGWGGKFEESDNALECSLRELEEEIEKSFDVKLGLKLSDLLLQGVLVRHDLKRVVYILKAPLRVSVPEGNVFNEGRAVYRSIDFHLKNKEFFLPNDLEFLDDLFFTKCYFRTIVNEDSSIEHYVLSEKY